MTFRADEGIGDQHGDFLRRKWTQAAKFALGFARHGNNEIDPSRNAGADDLGDLGIGPAGGDQFLQHTHVA